MSWQIGEVPASGRRVELLSDVEKGVRVCLENLDLTHAGDSQTMNVF